MERAEGLPGFYAILPLLPLLLIIVSAALNRLGVVSFEAGILPVTVVSLMVTMIIESIRLRNVNYAVDSFKEFFAGLGEGAARGAGAAPTPGSPGAGPGVGVRTRRG